MLAWAARVNTCHTSYQRRCMHTMPKPTQSPDISSLNISRTHPASKWNWLHGHWFDAHVPATAPSASSLSDDHQSDTERHTHTKKNAWRQLWVWATFVWQVWENVDKIRQFCVCEWVRCMPHASQTRMRLFLILWPYKWIHMDVIWSASIVSPNKCDRNKQIDESHSQNYFFYLTESPKQTDRLPFARSTLAIFFEFHYLLTYHIVIGFFFSDPERFSYAIRLRLWSISYYISSHPNQFADQKYIRIYTTNSNRKTCLRLMSNVGVNDQDYKRTVVHQIPIRINSDVSERICGPCICCYFIHDIANTLLLTHSCPHQRLHTRMHTARRQQQQQRVCIYCWRVEQAELSAEV